MTLGDPLEESNRPALGALEGALLGDPLTPTVG